RCSGRRRPIVTARRWARPERPRARLTAKTRPRSTGAPYVSLSVAEPILMSEKESLGIRRIASLHVYVRDLERSRQHYVEKLDFAEIAVSTPQFEAEHRARASVVAAGGARFVFMEPLGAKGESF